MLVTAVLFWFFTSRRPAYRVTRAEGCGHGKRRDGAEGPARVALCQYYSIVFGGYVALSLWMTALLRQSTTAFEIRTGGAAGRCFSLPGGVLRAIGGWFADKYGAHTRHLVGAVGRDWCACSSCPTRRPNSPCIPCPARSNSMSGSIRPLFTIIMFTMGIAFAIGKASVFKYISDDYPDNIGVVSGVVGLAGGMGGFVLPIMFGALVDLTGVRSSAFMLMFGVVWVSLMWMYFTEVRPIGAEQSRQHQRAHALRLILRRLTKRDEPCQRIRRLPPSPAGC